MVWLHLGINNGTSDYSPTPGWFMPPLVFESSNLPIIVIETEGGASIPDDPKIPATMGIIYNGEGEINYLTDPFNEFEGLIGIEIRGSSSATFPKKGYGVETWKPDMTNLNVSIFDWPADNDWVLYAPYSDKSLIRNVLTYKLGNEMGQYAPRTKLVEVVLNGEYIGVYVFTEKIKVNPGRVDIDELHSTDLDATSITGGYILKVDKTTGGGVVAWTSPHPQAAPATGPVRYQLHDPSLDSLHPSQLAYLQNYVTAWEDALASVDFADPVLGYRPYIDVASFIDFMIVNEISKNVDGYRISTFLHKERDDKGGKLKAGPLWDFNLAWGNANYCQGGLTTGWEIYFNNVCGGGGSLNNPFWYNRMTLDPEYNHELHCRWLELRQDILHTDSILAFIDEQAAYLADAADRNFIKWQTLGNYVWPNNFIGDTYEEEIGYLKSWTIDRMNWLDANMFGSCTDLGIDDNTTLDDQWIVYPNPASHHFNLKLSSPVNGIVRLIDVRGKLVGKQLLKGEETLFDFELAPGIYTIQLEDYDNGALSVKKIIIQ